MKNISSGFGSAILYKGFLLGVSMRENCYSCNYSKPERVSDITIGDFIGLGKTIPFDFPTHNVSSVTTNTQRVLFL